MKAPLQTVFYAVLCGFLLHTSITYTSAHQALSSVRNMLLEGEFDNRDSNAVALAKAVYKGETDHALNLIQHGVAVDSSPTGLAPLHIAAGRGHLDIVRALLNAGANVNAAADSEEGGFTPLHMAAGMNRLDTVRALLEAGANVGLVDALGMKPLHLAAGVQNPDMVEVLIQQDTDIDAVSPKYHSTPLLHALKNKKLDAHGELSEDTKNTMRKLVEYGATIDPGVSLTLSLLDNQLLGELQTIRETQLAGARQAIEELGYEIPQDILNLIIRRQGQQESAKAMLE